MRTPKIPDGYKRLKPGTLLIKGDRYWAGMKHGGWYFTRAIGGRLGNHGVAYIRKKTKTDFRRERLGRS